MGPHIYHAPFRRTSGLRATGSPTVVRQSADHISPPTSRLLENWFKGTLYVQQICIGHGRSADNVVGRLLLSRWCRLRCRLWCQSLCTMQQRMFATRGRWVLPATNWRTLPRGYQPGGVLTRGLYSIGIRPHDDRLDARCDQRSSDLQHGFGDSDEYVADIQLLNQNKLTRWLQATSKLGGRSGEAPAELLVQCDRRLHGSAGVWPLRLLNEVWRAFHVGNCSLCDDFGHSVTNARRPSKTSPLKLSG